jgi:hypothetical protein
MLNTNSCLRARISLFLLFFGFSGRQFSRPRNIIFEVNRATFRYQPEVLDCVDERLVVVTQPDTDFLNQLGHLYNLYDPYRAGPENRLGGALGPCGNGILVAIL